MKTLIVAAHPAIEDSVINKRWIEELAKHPDQYTVHQLYKAYPDGNIHVEQEQQLIEAHSSLVLQFPIHWFNCPYLLKKWLDDVFTYGWAYGTKGDKLKNRKIGLAVSAGISAKEYSTVGRYQHSLEHFLSPFKTTFEYCNADFRSIFACYGQEHAPGENTPDSVNPAPAASLEQSAKDYLHFLKSL